MTRDLSDYIKKDMNLFESHAKRLSFWANPRKMSVEEFKAVAQNFLQTAAHREQGEGVDPHIGSVEDQTQALKHFIDALEDGQDITRIYHHMLMKNEQDIVRFFLDQIQHS